jgi:hypothetical protein
MIWRQGYNLLNVSVEPDAAVRFSGENVSSMFVMAALIESETSGATPSEQGETTAAIQPGEPVPMPRQKPKLKAKPVVAAAAAKTTPKSTATAKPPEQGAPAPQEADRAGPDPEGETAKQAETVDAAMAVPLTRRQKRLLRRQQQNQGPFLPWLR